MRLRGYAEARVPLTDRGRVLVRERGSCRKNSSYDAIEIRAARGGSALHDRKPVWREDESRQLVAEPLSGAQAFAVQLHAPRLVSREDDVGLECRLAQRATEGDAACIGAEADQLGVAARAWREALGPDVERLEQIRLPGAVRPVQQDDPRLEGQLERGVRAKVTKGDLVDDQPASRMGMIRYQKLSAGASMRPGRRRLMSLSCTVSAETASRPSRRKSGLKPISSSSPA